MAERISISCTSCGAGLKLDAGRLGKKVKCPKCNEVFVATSDEDDVEDIDEIEEEEVQPKRKAGQPAGKGKGKKGPAKKSNGSGLLIGLIAGGVALLLVIGVGLYAAGVFSSNAAPENAVAAAPAPAAQHAATAPASSAPAAAHGATVAASSPAGSHAASPASVPAAPTASQDAQSPDAALASEEPPPGVADIRWFPPETEMVLTLRMAELWDSALIQALRKDPGFGPQIEQIPASMTAMWGFNPVTDVLSVSLGGWNLKSLQRPSPAGATPADMPADMPADGPADGPAQPGLPFLAHILLKEPMPLSKLEEIIKGDPARPAETVLNQESPIPTLRVSRPGVKMLIADSILIAQTSPSSVLVGAPPAVEAAIARGKQGDYLKPFNALSRKFQSDRFSFNIQGRAPQFAMIAVEKTPQQNTPAPVPPGAPAWVDELSSTMQRESNGFGLAIRVDGGIAVQTVLATKTPEGAQSLQMNLQQAIENAGMQYTEQKETMPSFATELLDPLMTSLKVEDAGSAVRISAGLPDTLQTQITQLPAKIMGYMMMASMKPGGMRPEGMPALPGDPSTLPFPQPGTANASPLNAVLAASVPSVAPVTANNLPEGASLAAKVYLKPASSDRANVPPVQLAIAIAVQGLPTEDDFLQLGRLSFKKITANGKQAMRANQTVLNVVNPQEGNEIISVSEFPPIPSGEILVGEALILPPRYAVNILSTVEGAFIMRRGTVLKEFDVPDVSAVDAETTPDDDALKSAGVKLRRETGKAKNAQGRQTEAIVISASKGHAFSNLELVDEAGNPAPEVVVESFVASGNPGWRVFLDQETKLPPGLTLKGKLIGDIQDESVTFRFENIQMPSANQNPAQTPGENAGQPGGAGTPMP